MLQPQRITMVDPRMGTSVGIVPTLLRRIPLDPCPTFWGNAPLVTSCEIKDITKYDH